jgi:hypothetical protein
MLEKGLDPSLSDEATLDIFAEHSKDLERRAPSAFGVSHPIDHRHRSAAERSLDHIVADAGARDEHDRSPL